MNLLKPHEPTAGIPTDANRRGPAAPEPTTFVETALRLGGKSEEEARRTGAMDMADEHVESLFEKFGQTSQSPIHRAVWSDEFPLDLFGVAPRPAPQAAQRVMQDSLAIVERRQRENTLLDSLGKIAPETLAELGRAGYWGLLIPTPYGGSGMPFSAFAGFVTHMAVRQPTVAGLASVHGCIGAVDPLLAFGNEEQKSRYLPKLASGEKLSGFALTEPAAGSDLTALRTTAELRGEHYVINGEKLFITNALPGRTVGLVCLVQGKPAVLLADLPEQENERFSLKRYGLWALKHAHNNGLIFSDFHVPKENLLVPRQGDGLTIAYHGLNRGRISLCATAGGTMRRMLAGMVKWSGFRKTYGQSISRRELVRGRMARMAGLIVAADAMSLWGATLLDMGYRGELECIIAKVFGSEAQKYAAIELMMKTHGGRSFLRGHYFGDEVHEFLAPCIYEGEGEVLGLAMFKALVKQHGSRYYEPLGKAMHAAGIQEPNPFNPAHAWKLRKAAMPYVKWWLGQKLGGRGGVNVPAMPGGLSAHARFAATSLRAARFELDAMMQRHAMKLPDRQCAIAEASQRIQDMVVMLVTAMHAARQSDPCVHLAAEVLCDEWKRKLTGTRPTSAEFRRLDALGARISEGAFSPLADVPADDILMPYPA